MKPEAEGDRRTAEWIVKDVASGIVVYLVALPLCLGIAIASGCPPMAGIIAGVVGGVIVTTLSGSPLSVTGPAAGLTVLVNDGIKTLGSFEAFTTSVVVAGFLQIVFALFRLGFLVEYVPVAVVRGLLAGIGGLICVKQLHIILGIDNQIIKTHSIFSHTTVSLVINEAYGMTVILFLIALLVNIAWDKCRAKLPLARLIPGSLVAVIIASSIPTLLSDPFYNLFRSLEVRHFVAVPDFTTFSSIISFPPLSRLLAHDVWRVGLSLAIVASIETLLSIEAVDRIDPQRRFSPPNRELVAQGVGNIISGVCGGLPLTAVIIRSSANVYAGGVTKLSAILHGLLIAVSMIVAADLLKCIPLSALSAVLVIVGFKLMHPRTMQSIIKDGKNQYIPFFATFFGVITIDLLVGVACGVALGLLGILKRVHNRGVSLTFDKDGNAKLFLPQELSFLHKASLKSILATLPNGAKLIIDAQAVVHLDRDIADILTNFSQGASRRGISISIMGGSNRFVSADFI